MVLEQYPQLDQLHVALVLRDSTPITSHTLAIHVPPAHTTLRPKPTYALLVQQDAGLQQALSDAEFAIRSSMPLTICAALLALSTRTPVFRQTSAPHVVQEQSRKEKRNLADPAAAGHIRTP